MNERQAGGTGHGRESVTGLLASATRREAIADAPGKSGAKAVERDA